MFAVYVLKCMKGTEYQFVMDSEIPDDIPYGEMGSEERARYLAYFAEHCLQSQRGTLFALERSKGDTVHKFDLEQGVN